MDMIIRMYPIGGLKGQKAHSPGQRPGYSEQTIYVKERAKALLPVRAFALAGRGIRHLSPRALPWAMGLLAFLAPILYASDQGRAQAVIG